MRVALTVVALTAIACSSPTSESTVSLEARVGDPCKLCDSCRTTVPSCVCSTCTDYARDAEAKNLLVCTTSGWSVYKKCPGGVSLTCTTSHTYRTSCLDDKGNEVP
jgi:hypothetical protein